MLRNGTIPVDSTPVDSISEPSARTLVQSLPREVAGGELRVGRAGVEQRRRRVDEAQRRQRLVELDRALLAVLGGLRERDAHRHAHPERLRELERLVALDGPEEVALDERRDGHVAELLVALGHDRLGERLEVVVGHALVEQIALDAGFDRLHERGAVGCLAERPVGPGHVPGVAPARDPRGRVVVGGVALGARGQHADQRLVDLVGVGAVVAVALGGAGEPLAVAREVEIRRRRGESVVDSVGRRVVGLGHVLGEPGGSDRRRRHSRRRCRSFSARSREPSPATRPVLGDRVKSFPPSL